MDEKEQFDAQQEAKDRVAGGVGSQQSRVWNAMVRYLAGERDSSAIQRVPAADDSQTNRSARGPAAKRAHHDAGDDPEQQAQQ